MWVMERETGGSVKLIKHLGWSICRNQRGEEERAGGVEWMRRESVRQDSGHIGQNDKYGASRKEENLGEDRLVC